MRNFIDSTVHIIESGWLKIRLEWAGDVARIKERRDDFKILTGKPTVKRPLRQC